MQDGLEKFAQKNRIFFDSETPSPFIWEGIEAKLESGKHPSPSSDTKGVRLKILHYTRIAAAVLVLLTIGGILGSYLTQFNLGNSSALTFGQIDEEYAEIEQYYSKQVNAQVDQLKQYNYDESIMEDIAELDVAFQDLKKELIKNGTIVNDETIIHAMIENYQAKIAILERVIERLEEKKRTTPQTKRKGHEINL